MASLGAVTIATSIRWPPFDSPSANLVPLGSSLNFPSSLDSTTAGAFSVCSISKRNSPFFSFKFAIRQHHHHAEANRNPKLATAAATKASSCECYDLFEELVPYVTAWEWQRATVDRMCAAVARGEDPSNSVVLLQHPPVYTMGTRSSDNHLRFDKENPPFELHITERGGEVTYHGPGQLVMYPILNLRHHKMDLHWYLRMLEEIVIRTLWTACGLEAQRSDGLTGVWVGEAKVAAIGVRVSRWITYHGLALNVNTDLTPFQNIVPCGIGDRPVGSVQQLLNNGRNQEDLKKSLPMYNGCHSSPSQGLKGSYKTGVTSEMSKTIEKIVGEDKMLLSRVHHTLLAEFAELFQLELVPPTRDGPTTARYFGQ